MDKEQLNSAFDVIAPSEKQKEKMLKEILCAESAAKINKPVFVKKYAVRASGAFQKHNLSIQYKRVCESRILCLTQHFIRKTRKEIATKIEISFSRSADFVCCLPSDLRK